MSTGSEISPYADSFSSTITKTNIQIDEANSLVKFNNVTGVTDPTKAGVEAAKAAGKVALAAMTGGLSLLSKKGRTFSSDTDGGSVIVQLSEITSWELIENTGAIGASAENTKVSGVGVGARSNHFGIGIGGGRKTSEGVFEQTESIESLSVVVKTTSLEYPVITIQFLQGKTTRDTREYQSALNAARGLIGTLDALQAQGRIGSSQSELPDIGVSDEAVEQLKKLKDLLDLGVLTQEEYETKKAALLNS